MFIRLHVIGGRLMNRIDHVLNELKINHQKALIPFITAGDPNLATTEKLVLEMVKQGADIIEIGIPFSDPVAEGPVIQEASERALRNGVTLTQIFGAIGRLRNKTEVPLVMMMYMNNLYCYGKEKFFADCKAYGVDAVIVPDVPFEEKEEISTVADEYGVYVIDLIAPTSSKERIKMIASQSKGFLYCVSSVGVTGMRQSFADNLNALVGAARKYTITPPMLGFGISNAQQVKEVKDYVDGVIVGSSIVRIVGQYGEASISRVGTFVSELKGGLLED